MSRRTRSTVKFVCSALAATLSSVSMFSTPMLQGPAVPFSPAAGDHGDFASAAQADPPAVEDLRREAGTKLAATAAAELKEALPFKEELALLRKRQAEPRQVDLRLVGLDLREIGVVREISRQARCQAVLHVEAPVGIDIAFDGRIAGSGPWSRARWRTA